MGWGADRFSATSAELRDKRPTRRWCSFPSSAPPPRASPPSRWHRAASNWREHRRIPLPYLRSPSCRPWQRWRIRRAAKPLAVLSGLCWVGPRLRSPLEGAASRGSDGLQVLLRQRYPAVVPGDAEGYLVAIRAHLSALLQDDGGTGLDRCDLGSAGPTDAMPQQEPLAVNGAAGSRALFPLLRHPPDPRRNGRGWSAANPWPAPSAAGWRGPSGNRCRRCVFTATQRPRPPEPLPRRPGLHLWIPRGVRCPAVRPWHSKRRRPARPRACPCAPTMRRIESQPAGRSAGPRTAGRPQRRRWDGPALGP